MSVDLGFEFRGDARHGVSVLHRGRPAATLRGRAAEKFLADCERLDAAGRQQLMARITGNYRHGNERTARRHARNRRSS